MSVRLVQLATVPERLLWNLEAPQNRPNDVRMDFGVLAMRMDGVGLLETFDVSLIQHPP